MAITASTTLSSANVSAYSFSAGGAVTLTATLSVISTLVQPPLSGNNLVSAPTFTFVASAGSNSTSLTAANQAIALTFGSNSGNQIIYGNIASSTLSLVTSTFQATVTFLSLEYSKNTVITLSGTSLVGLVSVPATTFDNPFYTTNISFTGPNGSNISHRTVGEHQRKRLLGF